MKRVRRLDPASRVMRDICAALGVEPGDIDEFRAALELTDNE